MNRPNRSALLPAAALALGAALAAQADAGADPTRGLCRYPDVSQTEIVFVYANDLWVVPKAGGVARPVAKALMYSGFGVPLYVAGMMVAAFGLRSLGGH